jgi:heme/copper-type cytochrome/quinol oxidase subunit 3
MSGAHLFKLPFMLGETALLLLSSFTFAAAVLESHAHRKAAAIRWLAATFVLGAAFIGMEVVEFAELIHEGGAERQRFPVVLLHAGRHARAACAVWLAVAGRPDPPDPSLRL